MKISVIIPTFNRAAILAETLRSLESATRAVPAEIIVVNNSKTEKVSAASAQVRVLDNPGSGPASGRNFGARHAAGELLIFLDDDILLSEGNLRRLVRLHAERPDSCFNPDWKYSDEVMRRLHETSSGRYILHIGLIDYRSWVSGLPWRDGEVFPAPKLAAFCLSIRRDSFQKVGGFPESFKHMSLEDDEFSDRLKANGTNLLIDSSQVVYHNELDRIGLASRLNRIKAGALNKRHAVELGMTEYRMEFSWLQRACFALLSTLKPALFALSEAVPNSTWFDLFYRRLAVALVRTVTYEGYYRQDDRMI